MSVGDLYVYAPGQRGEIDLCTAGCRVVWDASGIDAAALHLDQPGVAYPTSAVATVKFSNDNLTYYTDGVATLTAASSTGAFDVTGWRYVCLETTTAGSGTAPIAFNATLFGRPGVKA